MTIKIVIPHRLQWELDDSLPLWKELEEKFNVEFIKYPITTPEAFKDWLPKSELDGIWMTEEFCSLIGGPSPYLDYFPDTLKVMLVPWVGTDYVLSHDQIKTIRNEKGIFTVNVGPNASNSVAEMAIYLLLSCFRMASFWEYELKFAEHGKISNCRDYLGSELTDIEELATTVTNVQGSKQLNSYKFPKKLIQDPNGEIVNVVENFKVGGKLVSSAINKKCLVLGFGSIGQKIAQRLHFGFDMDIFYYRRSGSMTQEQLGFPATFVDDIEENSEAWSQVDCIVLALPGNASTDNIINARTLSWCKDGVRIVNVGRGNAIDEDALIAALDSGKVASAGLDVYKNEGSGQINKKLVERWDVTALPHMGSAVQDMMSLQTQVTLENIKNIFVDGGEGKYPVIF